MSLVVGKLPAGNMFHAGATARTGFVGRGNPLTIARSAVAENIVFVCLGKPSLPFAPFIRAEIWLWIGHRIN